MPLKWTTAGVAALALTMLANAAEAQNSRSRAVKRTYAAAPVVNWNGFYGGVNLGYGASGLSDNLPLAGTTLMTGVIGGVQAGFNYRWNSAVLGIEADIQASDMNNTYGVNLPVVGNISIGHRIPYFGTVRGRLGYAFTCGCVMAYATAGIAYGAYEPHASAFGLTVSQTYTNTAFAAGAGVEWMVAQRWSTKLEAIYFDTGNIGTGVTLPFVGRSTRGCAAPSRVSA